MSTEAPDKAPPVYNAGEAPEHLRTMTQLKADRLKVAEGQKPVAFRWVLMRGAGWTKVPLYDPAAAAKMRPLSAKQQQAMDARRTCPECHIVRGYVVHRRCQDCRDKAILAERELYARTCHHCKRVSGAALAKDAYGWVACDPCRVRPAIRREAEREKRAMWARTCPGRDCAKVTATDEEIAAARAAREAPNYGWSPRWCPPCKERDTRERAEREKQQRKAAQRAKEARQQELRDLEAWARTALADPTVAILDTETTGLDSDARIVDLAVTTVGGKVLLNTLINPGVPIPAEATNIHGITDDMATGAPTFADILVRLTAALDGRRCLIYNASYDTARLRYELTRHYQAAGHAHPEQSAAAWLDTMTFEDAMIPYSDWYGDWSEYFGNYTWQPLYGGDHRALGDCLAVIDRLKEMSAEQSAEQIAAGGWPQRE